MRIFLPILATFFLFSPVRSAMKKTPDKGVALLVKAATEKEDRQVLALIKRGSSLPQAVCYAARIRNRAALKFLLEIGGSELQHYMNNKRKVDIGLEQIHTGIAIRALADLALYATEDRSTDLQVAAQILIDLGADLDEALIQAVYLELFNSRVQKQMVEMFGENYLENADHIDPYLPAKFLIDLGADNKKAWETASNRWKLMSGKDPLLGATKSFLFNVYIGKAQESGLDKTKSRMDNRVLARLASAVEVVDTRNNFAFATTPLHEAVVKINRKKVRALIISGIDINARDSVGMTPLGMAKIQEDIFVDAVREQEQINMVERENNKRIIEMLTEAGAKE